LFGIGGGVILVPILITVFGAGDLVAKGTSLVVMLPTALMGTWQNARARLVDLRAAAVVGVAAVGASFAGVAVAFRLSPELSTTLFAILVVVSVTQLAVRAVRKDREWFRARLRARRDEDEGGGARAAGGGPAWPWPTAPARAARPPARAARPSARAGSPSRSRPCPAWRSWSPAGWSSP